MNKIPIKLKWNLRYTKLTSMILFGYLLPFVVWGQNESQANRYINAYKQYISADCPVEDSEIKHFVYFSRDRELIYNHPFLENEQFEGAQIMYAWKQLEPRKGQYDFSLVKEDYNYLLLFGKKLFIQLQDATFNSEYVSIPAYMLSKEYDGGAIYQRNDKGDPEGWVAKRWNDKVQERFALLLMALGKEFDGKIEGINLQETAIGVSQDYDSSFTPEQYVEAIMTNMVSMKKAFPESTTMQYANFMVGEWLPWEDHGYLKSIYEYGEEIGVGLGSPDLMVQRKAQLNHALAMMHEREYSVPLGIAIQDGNYLGKTGADPDYNELEGSPSNEHRNLVPLLHSFAKEFLKVSYMFWVNQEPYFAEDVLPCFTSNQLLNITIQ